MIIKHDMRATFQKLGERNQASETGYASLDDLLRSELLDGIGLEEGWDRVETIVVDNSWNLCLELDAADLNERYRFLDAGQP